MKPEEFPIAQPCEQRWEEMNGGELRRLCEQCDRNVYNLSHMSADEARRFWDDHHHHACIGYFVDEDSGEIIFDGDAPSAPDPLQVIKRLIVSAWLTVPLAAGCDSEPAHSPAEAEAIAPLDPSGPAGAIAPPRHVAPTPNRPPKAPERRLVRAFAFGMTPFSPSHSGPFALYRVRDGAPADDNVLLADFETEHLSTFADPSALSSDVRAKPVGRHSLFDRQSILKNAGAAPGDNRGIEHLTEIHLEVPSEVVESLRQVRGHDEMLLLAPADEDAVSAPVGIVLSPATRQTHYERFVGHMLNIDAIAEYNARAFRRERERKRKRFIGGPGPFPGR